jgi:ATP-dependent Lhr-like helicase
MSLASFHPVVAQWWRERFADPSGPGFAPPTSAQERGWAAIRSGRDTLIAAPTGSGKTLAAFLHAIDELAREALDQGLPNETRVLYVSPLKALSTDVHKNLTLPFREMRGVAEALGLPAPRITASVRTGDTPQPERAAMLRTPPHILVTTPESLYLLLTAERGREMLRTVRTVIVDEIHAVIESRRGAHLGLSLERLDHVTQGSVQRIGLSATQKPIATVAQFLTRRDCTVIDEGHLRDLDLALELPGSPLEAVMSAETWQEVYARLEQLVEQHRTTIVFVNTRRLAERVARSLSERLGVDAVTAHHGSLAKEVRLDAEERLKAGKLKALVATASLELGIDIGHVDLVCQIASPHRVATLLQRVGRSGHTVGGKPKGRLFPLTRDDLVECAALLRCVRAGELDHLIVPSRPLDVLAQQIVAETAAEEWTEDALFDLVRGAYSYRDLERAEFDEVVAMVSTGFSTQRGRRGALLHHDAVNHRLRGRRGSRLTAITSGGAIPEVADYRVVLEPEGTFIGTLNEDFAIESMAGDIFQLGNASWRILRVQQGVVRVADAQGQPPTIPFWLGEGPSRSAELSVSVSGLREDVAALPDAEAAAAALLERDGISAAAALQIAAYLHETKRMLGVVPTQSTVVLERFFDEAGGMQLIVHAPFGSRVNRAWGLALRKKFCLNFSFELQAAATEEGIVLSLGPQQSFPLDDVFRYLHPAMLKDTLVQAVLDAPLFQTRWRWNATLSLAVRRSRGGTKVAPQLQRMQAADFLTAVFPESTACQEHIVGPRAIPDHPLVRQTLKDCLDEAMDLPALERVIRAIVEGGITCVARDTPEPSPLCHEILNARPYAFLDDAPLEERRTQAVQTRRATQPGSAADLGALDEAAIARVRDEARPDPQNADELHDALLMAGFLLEAEGRAGAEGVSWDGLFDELVRTRRAAQVTTAKALLWVAAERLPEVRAAFGVARVDPELQVPSTHARDWAREAALEELLRGRLEITGPVTVDDLSSVTGWPTPDIDIALLALESRGLVLRGYFTPGAQVREWCDRRLLARIHRYTLNRLRAEIQPVTASELLRFLFRWQRVDRDARMSGLEGLATVLEMLDGYQAPAAAWESAILPARCQEYEADLLDMLCMTGRLAWGRLDGGANGRASSKPLRSSPIALFTRANAAAWLELARRGDPMLSADAELALEVLRRRGASFFHELVAESRMTPTHVERALGELAGAGWVTSDSFSGLRALLVPSAQRAPLSSSRAPARVSVVTAGRWSLLGRGPAAGEPEASVRRVDDGALETQARLLLRRYGVVFRRIAQHDGDLVPWRDLVRVYRRLEARGEIRGGRFVAGFAGEHFALPDAVNLLRATRKEPPSGELLTVSAADPLNLTGVLTPDERVPAITSNRVVFRDGVAVAAYIGREVRLLPGGRDLPEAEVRAALSRRRASPAVPGRHRGAVRGMAGTLS